MNIMIIPDIDNIGESLKLAEDWNLSFEYNDFFRPDILDDPAEIKRRVNIYKKLDRDRSSDTLHGAFFDVTIHSDDRLIAEISSKRVHASMDIAEELGVKGVVFHTNTIPNFCNHEYIEGWIEKNSIFWDKLTTEYSGISIYIENMFDIGYEAILGIGRQMKDNNYFGICLDYAHAVAFGKNNPKEWFDRLSPYIKHMHINDNDLISDLHLAVGDGSIDWSIYAELLRQYNVDASVLIEVNGYDAQIRSLNYLKKHNIISCLQLP